MRSNAKRLAQTAVAASALFLSLGSAQAVVVDGNDVGSIDNLVNAYDSGNSGDDAEIAALEAACGCSLTLDVKNEAPVVLETNGIFAIDVSPDSPGYYLLKFGGGQNTYDTAIFENLADMNWLVWSAAQLTESGIADWKLLGLSHYTYGEGGDGGGGGGGGGAPEPASLALVGLALALAGVAGKRRKQARG
jgi:hypothetical protein